MIIRSTDVKAALRSRQRGFLLNPYRFGVQDPYFPSVLFLSNYASDTSDVKGHTVTPTGSPTVSAGALNTNGTTQFIRSLSSDFNNLRDIDFTLETWVTSTLVDSNFRAISAIRGSDISGTNGLQLCIYQYNTNKFAMAYCTSEGVAVGVQGATVVVDTKYHVAISYTNSSNTLRLFTGGVMGASATNWANLAYGNQGIAVGANAWTTGAIQFFAGKVHAIRLTAVNRYPSDTSFTPPEDPFLET